MWTDPTSLTLEPQVIDAAVVGEATSGAYKVYTVHLAPYDVIVQMNNQVIDPNGVVLSNPATVYVYVGPNTSMYNSTALGVGGTFRFTGLLFDDGGTARLVAGQVDDGAEQ